MTNLPKDLLSLQRQLAEARENLRLIQERKAEFVLSTDVPLQLVKEERHWLDEIAELEQQSAASIALAGSGQRQVSQPLKQPLYGPSGQPRIFLCHASEDKPRVQELYHRLKQAGYHPWLDREDLLPGQDWWEEIERIIREPYNVVVVCLSCNSVTKRAMVQREIKWALDVLDEMPAGTIYLIPARLEECQVPDRLSKLHWVNLFEADGFGKLIQALNSAGMSGSSSLATKYFSKATRALLMGDLGEAERCYRKVLDIDPFYPRAKEQLNHVQELMAREALPSYGRAREQLNRVQELMARKALPLLRWLRPIAAGSTKAPAQLVKQAWTYVQNHPAVFAAIAGLVALLLVGRLDYPTAVEWLNSTSTPTSTPTITSTLIPAGTPPTLAPPPATATATPPGGSTKTRLVDGMVMVYVPGGTFEMGSTEGATGEQPVHTVTLDGFWIDRTEVTNAQYARCVAAGVCRPPSQSDSEKRQSYYGDSQYNEYPVIYVSWDDATTYCKWAGGAAAHRGRVGICLSGWKQHRILLWRRSVHVGNLCLV